MINVSIILPVFNAEKNIKNTIKSVLNQTFKNIELVIIDDGSTDNSFQICQEMNKQDNRIVLKKIKNNGVSNARNTGLEVARGKYIMFIDSDDEYKPTIVDKLLKNIKTSDLSVCNFEILKDNGKVTSKNLKFNCNCDETDKCINFLQKNNLFNAVWNKMYKKEIIVDNQIKFNKDITIGEDLEFNLKYFNYIKKISYTNESLYIYKIANNGLNYRYHEDRIFIRKQLYEYETDIFRKNNFSEKLLYKEYIKICLAELKQVNYLAQNDKIVTLIKKILSNQDRKKKLQQIKKNGNFEEIILANLLSNMFSMIIICKIIKILKK